MADLITTIARARASMMLRGHRDLTLRLGPDCAADLRKAGDDQGIFTAGWPMPRTLFGMAIEAREDMEGWAVLPAGCC